MKLDYVTMLFVVGIFFFAISTVVDLLKKNKKLKGENRKLKEERDALDEMYGRLLHHISTKKLRRLIDSGITAHKGLWDKYTLRIMGMINARNKGELHQAGTARPGVEE
jgi:hypothetical protein